jgi:formimidoylglutamate deiminase
MTTLWFDFALLPHGWARRVRLSLKDGLIDAVESGVDPNAQDERRGVALPGLANLHSHAFQRGMAGLAESAGPTADSFWSWRTVMYRFLERMNPSDVEAVAALAYAEMLECGFTRVGEFHYLHKDRDGGLYANPGEMAERIAAAAAETGIGLTLLPVFYVHAGFGGLDPLDSQRRMATGPAQFQVILEASRKTVGSLAGAVLGVAPHSLRAVTPDELQWLLSLSPNGPVHIHIAEQIGEVEGCLAWSGQRPIEWLLDHAAVDDRWCLVHATHANDQEIGRIAGSGAVVGLCPITEANLGDGVFPAQSFAQQGGLFGVGSDSNVLIDAAEEMRLLDYGQRLAGRSRNPLATGDQTSGRSIFEGALVGGARALGCGFGLRPGGAADLFSLDLKHPSLVCRQGDPILDAWIYAARSQAVDCVWTRGVQVVRGGSHIRKNEIVARYRRVIGNLVQA